MRLISILKNNLVFRTPVSMMGRYIYMILVFLAVIHRRKMDSREGYIS